MELDELKSAWAQYDKKLTENLQMNEELLRKMNLQNSKKEMQKPLIYELIGIAFLFVLTVYIVASTVRFIAEPKFSIPGVIVALCLIIYMIFGIIRANKFMNIDYYGSSVLQVQKDIAKLKKLVLQLRKYELILIPVLAIPLIPICFKAFHNVDIYQNVKLFIIEIVLILGLGYPLTLWMNTYLYDRKFRNAENLLEELEKFEKEE